MSIDMGLWFLQDICGVDVFFDVKCIWGLQIISSLITRGSLQGLSVCKALKRSKTNKNLGQAIIRMKSKFRQSWSEIARQRVEIRARNFGARCETRDPRHEKMGEISGRDTKYATRNTKYATRYTKFRVAIRNDTNNLVWP